MTAERNLLFGVVAWQLGFIDQARFIDACAAWSAGTETTIAASLLERGWVTRDQHGRIELGVNAKVEQQQGDEVLALRTAADRQVCEALDVLDLTQSIQSFDLPSRQEGFDPTTDVTPTERLHYKLTHVHGRGGVGRVWLAFDNRLNRKVALKEIHPETEVGDEAIARFLREAQITGQLEHPNIVPVYELIHPEGESPFYTMRFLRGQSLRSAIREFHRARQRLPLKRSSELTRLLNDFIAVCNQYETAQQLAEDVQRWLSDEPVSVYEEAWSERTTCWARKHRTRVQDERRAMVWPHCAGWRCRRLRLSRGIRAPHRQRLQYGGRSR